MYSGIPKRERRRIKASLTASWSSVAAAGVGGLFIAPSMISSQLGFWTIASISATAFVSALIAVAGVLQSKYQWEWWASWFAAAGVAPYAVVLWWWMFVTGGIEVFTHATLITGLLFFIISRAQMCAAHAAKLRLMHEAIIETMGELDARNDDS